MFRHVLLTFRGTIGSGHNNNTVQKQILKKLLKNHGISDISDLFRLNDTKRAQIPSDSFKPLYYKNRAHHGYGGM